MTRIDLSALAREFADAPVDAVATVRVQGWAGSAPASTVDGAGVVFSPRNEVIVRGDTPDRTVELPPTDGTFCYRWDVSMRSGTLKLATRYTLVPESDVAVPFGDLVEVLPGSLEPSDGGRAAWDLVRTDAEGFRDEAAESARIAVEAVDTPGRQGPQGIQGPAGPQGPQGATGLPGATGPAGPSPTAQSYADALSELGAARDAVLSMTRDDIASRTSPAGLTLWKRAPARTLTFYDADATGVADASLAWETALSEVPTGGILSIPEGVFKVPDVAITRSDVAVEGPGLLHGRVTVGQSGSTTDFVGRGFHGVRFARTGPVADPTFAGIRIRNAKRLRIERCWFYNMSSAVYSESSVGNDVANLNLVGNVYENVGYFFRAVTGAGAVWRSHADINILGNHGKARITHVKIDSVDGLRANNNRMFFYGFAAQDQQKERHFEIGYSDWLNISDNELFEAGLESITLTDPNHFELVENLIAWPSQRANRDAISVTLGVGRSGDATAPARTFSYGKIGGGVISQYSKASVGFYGTGHVGFVVITPTALERASGNPPTYYGTDTLGTPRRVSVAGSLTAIPPKTPEYNGELSGTMFDDFRGRVTAAERWLHPRAKEIALPSRDATITSKTSLYILRDLNQQSTTTTALGGIIHLDMRNAGTLAKTATYVLLVGTSPDGTRSCQVLGSVGRSAGGAANDPAFTFAVEHNGTNIVLQATPISPTSGAFSYSAVAEGNLTLG